MATQASLCLRLQALGLSGGFFHCVSLCFTVGHDSHVELWTKLEPPPSPRSTPPAGSGRGSAPSSGNLNRKQTEGKGHTLWALSALRAPCDAFSEGPVRAELGVKPRSSSSERFEAPFAFQSSIRWIVSSISMMSASRSSSAAIAYCIQLRILSPLAADIEDLIYT